MNNLEQSSRDRLISGEQMTPEERTAYLHTIKTDYDLTATQLAKYTGYARPTVKAWLSSRDSKAFRETPPRAVERLRMEVALGNVGPRKHAAVTT